MPYGNEWDYRLYVHGWNTYRMASSDLSLSERLSNLKYDMPAPRPDDPPGSAARTALYRTVAEELVDACLDHELSPELPRKDPDRHAKALRVEPVIGPDLVIAGAVVDVSADTARALLWRDRQYLLALTDRLRFGRLRPWARPEAVVLHDLAVLTCAAAHVSSGRFLSLPLGPAELALHLAVRSRPGVEPEPTRAAAAPVLGGAAPSPPSSVRVVTLDPQAAGMPWNVRRSQ